MLLTPAKMKPKSFESRRNYFFLFSRVGRVSLLLACLGARLLLQSYQYPNLSEGADRVAGQLRGDKECPFSGVTRSGRVWRKVPESDARNVHPSMQPKRRIKMAVFMLPLPTKPTIQRERKQKNPKHCQNWLRGN